MYTYTHTYTHVLIYFIIKLNNYYHNRLFAYRIFFSLFFTVFNPSYRTVNGPHGLVQHLEYDIPYNLNKDLAEFLTRGHDSIRNAIHTNLLNRGLFTYFYHSPYSILNKN